MIYFRYLIKFIFLFLFCSLSFFNFIYFYFLFPLFFFFYFCIFIYCPLIFFIFLFFFLFNFLFCCFQYHLFIMKPITRFLLINLDMLLLCFFCRFGILAILLLTNLFFWFAFHTSRLLNFNWSIYSLSVTIIVTFNADYLRVIFDKLFPETLFSV
jgi:hypothetical protein